MIPRAGTLLLSLLGILPGFSRLEGASVLTASPCTLTWSPSQDPSVTGYVLYFGVAGSSVTNRQVLGMTNTVTLFNLFASSNYFFYVAAYNAAGVESPPSNVLSYTPPALSAMKLTLPAAGTFQVRFRAAPGTPCLIQYTASLNPTQWLKLAYLTADANGNVAFTDQPPPNTPSRYYKAAIQ